MFGVALACAAACFEAGKDIYLSSARTRELPHLLRVFFLPLLSIPLVAILVWYRGFPEIVTAFWFYTGAHALLMVCANYCYMRALAIGAVSETQPMLALTPVFLIITTPLLTDDTVTLLGWMGVLIIALGIYATQHPGRDAAGKLFSFWEPFLRMWTRPGMSWMFTVAVIFSIAANLDKLAVVSADGPTYLLINFTLTAVFTGLFIGLGLLTQTIPGSSLRGIGQALRALAPGGLLSASGGLLHMWALSFLPVPYVIAFKRLSIVLASMWGYFLRRERAPHWFRILGVFFVFFGVAVILVFGKI